MLVFLLLSALLADAKTAQVVFQNNGGFVNLVGIDSSNTTFTFTTFAGPPDISYWRIHTLFVTRECEMSPIWNPTNQTVGVSCVGSACPAGDLSAKHGVLNFSYPVYNDPDISLFGEFSVIGRSMFFYDANDNVLTCGNIYNVPSPNTQAVFEGAIMGTINMAENAGETVIQVDLWWADSNHAVESGFPWHVHQNMAWDLSDCSACGGHLNPAGVNASACATLPDWASKEAGCESGDLAGKHGKLTIPGRYVFTDQNLPLMSGTNTTNAAGRSIVIHSNVNSSVRIQCANLGWQARAVFPGNTVGAPVGTVDFFQPSLDYPTTIRVQLTGLQYYNGTGNGWHVHNFPRRDNCYANATGIGSHYDPDGHNLHDGSYSCNASDPANTCEMGDLAGKLGKFMTENVSMTYIDQYLSLSSDTSIIGRSIMIHRNTGEPFACANIESPYMMKTVTVHFSGKNWGTMTTAAPMYGVLKFTQPLNFPYYETTFSMRFWSTANISGFSMNIYEGIPYPGDNCSDWVSNNQVINNPAWSELGLLSAYSGDIPAFTGVYEDLWTLGRDYWVKPLTGAFGLNQAPFYTVVLGDVGAEFLYCAPMGKMVTADLGANGMVNFFSPSALDPVCVDIDLMGLTNLPNTMHIHEFPVDSTGSCAPSSTGGHLNYMHVDTTPGVYNCSATNPMGCEAGDLTGRYGKLMTAAVDALHVDDMITTYGINSLVGRSIVIHDVNGTRVHCGTIGYGPGSMISQTSSFWGVVDGTVTLTQNSIYNDEETSIYLSYQYNDPMNATTMSHKFHVHMNPVGHMIDTVTPDCSTIGGHFNGWNVLPSGCANSTNKNRDCEIGDLSGRLGVTLTISNTTTRLFYTDAVVALSGLMSSKDRSIAIHNSGSTTYLSCASMMNTKTVRPSNCGSATCYNNSNMAWKYCTTCDPATCCSILQCSIVTCPAATKVLLPINCPNNNCTEDTCCTPILYCNGTTCGTGMRAKTNACPNNTCTADVCCETIPKCSSVTCPKGQTAKDIACPASGCTTDNCCATVSMGTIAQPLMVLVAIVSWIALFIQF